MIRFTPGQLEHHRPHDWLPEGVDMRVLFRFEVGFDLYPSFDGIKQDFASFSALPPYFATFHEMTLYETGGWADDYDVTCDVTGLSTNRGRNVLWDSIDAGTFEVDLRDLTGMYDPRSTTTPFGPDRRIRCGTRVEIDLDTGNGWFPIGVGFVDAWNYSVPSLGATSAEVKVTAVDGFGHLAQCVGPVTAPVGANETMGPRLNRILDHADWPSTWGGRAIAAGTVPLQATTLGGGNSTTVVAATEATAGTDALSEIKLVVRTEDGLVFMDRDGTFTAWDGSYRGRATVKLRVLGRGAEKLVATWGQTMTAHPTWQDLTKVTSWKSLVEGVSPLPGWHPDGGPDAAGVVAVCATTIEVADVDDDVRNDVAIQRANVPNDTNGNPTEPVQRREDETSVRRYGRHTFEDNTLIHTTASWTASMADRYLARYSDGEPRIDQVSIDMLRDWQVAEVVSTLNFGDLVEVADYVPANDALVITQLEVQGVRHDLGPTAWITTLRLDQPRDVSALWDWAKWDVGKWS